MPVNADIHPHQARGLINKLIRFCGRDKIDKGINSYKKSMKFNGEIHKLFLRRRHPWWELLIEYDQVIGAGKAFTSHILNGSGYIHGKWHGILSNAKMISEMYSLMPESVRKFYRGTLVDDNNAKSHLFELEIAWHYLRRGHNVEWVQSGGKKPEFVVSKDDFAFCIECKRISLGSYTNIRHEDFYRFCDTLLPRLSTMNLMGTIAITLNDKLPTRIDEQNSIADKIVSNINENGATIETDFGSVDYRLVQKDNRQVNVATLQSELNTSKPPNAFGIVYTDHEARFPQNPIQLTCICSKHSIFIDKIFRLIKAAAKDQLDKTMPGLVSVYIPEINDFTPLMNEGGLPAIATALFNKEQYNHVGSIVFNSDPHYAHSPGMTRSSVQALHYENDNCAFELANGFPFLTPEG